MNAPLLIISCLLAAQEPLPVEKISPQNKNALFIDAKARADDITKAYDFLKKDKPTLRISAHTANGSILANILELNPMPNGTLLIFKLSTPQGTKIQMISVDEFQDFFYGS